MRLSILSRMFVRLSALNVRVLALLLKAVCMCHVSERVSVCEGKKNILPDFHFIRLPNAVYKLTS